MLKRDSLTASMQQLSYILAKVKRLIVEDDEAEALMITNNVFQEYYRLTDHDLIEKTEDAFLLLIKTKGLQVEELNMLAYFMDEYAGLQKTVSNQLLVYKKLIRLFDFMEKELQYISFEHISRRAIIEKQI